MIGEKNIEEMNLLRNKEVINFQKVIYIFLLFVLIFSMCNYLIKGIFKTILGFNVDFVTYYSAARVIKYGEKLYDNTVLLKIQRESGLPESEGPMPYLYPPLFAVLMLPFTFMNYTFAKNLWLFLNQAFLMGALVFTWYSAKDKISCIELIFLLFLLLNFAPIFSNLNLGQVSILIFLLVASSFYLFKKRKDFWTGVLLAFATMFKITPGLLIVYFLWKKEYRVFFSALFSLIILFLLSIVLVGIETNYFYITKILLPLARSRIPHPSNQSYLGFFLRLFSNSDFANTLSIAASLITLMLAGFCCRKKVDRSDFRFNLEFSLVITAIFLISRVTWEHHLVWLLFPFITILVYLTEMRKIFLLVALAFSYAFIALQFNYIDPRLAKGIFILAMSPRMYGVLILYWLLVYTLLIFKNEKKKDMLPGIKY